MGPSLRRLVNMPRQFGKAKPSRGSFVNFSIYGIWNATQLILATGMQNCICPVAWSICQKKTDKISSLPKPPGGPPGACNVFTLGPLNSGGTNEPIGLQISDGVLGLSNS